MYYSPPPNNSVTNIGISVQAQLIHPSGRSKAVSATTRASPPQRSARGFGLRCGDAQGLDVPDDSFTTWCTCC